MNAELVPEGRLVAPISWATLGTHVVASPGSHGALEGGGLSVHSFDWNNIRCGIPQELIPKRLAGKVEH